MLGKLEENGLIVKDGLGRWSMYRLSEKYATKI
jgi:DNA-binding transcriptional ArsR family regulator